MFRRELNPPETLEIGKEVATVYARKVNQKAKGDYLFRLEVPVSRPVLHLSLSESEHVFSKFLVDSGASVNVVSSNADKVFSV